MWAGRGESKRCTPCPAEKRRFRWMIHAEARTTYRSAPSATAALPRSPIRAKDPMSSGKRHRAGRPTAGRVGEEVPPCGGGSTRKTRNSTLSYFAYAGRRAANAACPSSRRTAGRSLPTDTRCQRPSLSRQSPDQPSEQISNFEQHVKSQRLLFVCRTGHRPNNGRANAGGPPCWRIGCGTDGRHTYA